MYRLLFVLLIICNISAEESYPKCCDSESVLQQKNNSSYHQCFKNLHQRLQIKNEQDKGHNQCMDIENNEVNLYNYTEENYIKEKVLDLESFPKCCPLDFEYNIQTHSCNDAGKKNYSTFFDEKFIKVGLPECRIVVDVVINTTNNPNWMSSLNKKNTNAILEFLNSSTTDEIITTLKETNNGRHCFERVDEHQFIFRVCTDDYSICDLLKCVHKCCKDGQSFINGSKCYDTHRHGVNLTQLSKNVENSEEPFAIIHGYNPPVYPLKKSHFFLEKNGIFIAEELDELLEKHNITKYYNIQTEAYCIEHAIKGNLNKHMFFRQFPKKQIVTKFLYTRYAMAISCVFLLLTIIYYCISKEKRTVFGKILLSYCLISLLAFSLLSYLAFNLRPNKTGCVIVAFVVFYATLASFTWMNVMCIDIYWTFGSPKSFSSPQQRNKDIKRFILYSLYGWGAPTLLTLIFLLFYNVDFLPNFLEVLVNESKCFVHRGDGNYAQILFATSYLTVLEISNLILFIKTSTYCLQVKRDINKMNDTHTLKGVKRERFNKFQDRFGLIIKLFLIMGVSFLFEVVSTFYDFKSNKTTATIELLWDTINSLQGVFIFIIFVFKKRVLKQVANNLGFHRLGNLSFISANATTTTTLATKI